MLITTIPRKGTKFKTHVICYYLFIICVIDSLCLTIRNREAAMSYLYVTELESHIGIRRSRIEIKNKAYNESDKKHLSTFLIDEELFEAYYFYT